MTKDTEKFKAMEINKALKKLYWVLLAIGVFVGLFLEHEFSKTIVLIILAMLLLCFLGINYTNYIMYFKKTKNKDKELNKAPSKDNQVEQEEEDIVNRSFISSLMSPKNLRILNIACVIALIIIIVFAFIFKAYGLGLFFLAIAFFIICLEPIKADKKEDRDE